MFVDQLNNNKLVPDAEGAIVTANADVGASSFYDLNN